MKILHYLCKATSPGFPLDSPARFIDFLLTAQKLGHSNFVVLTDMPVLQASLERHHIDFHPLNVRFLKHLFIKSHVKKIVSSAEPDLLLYYGEDAPDDIGLIVKDARLSGRSFPVCDALGRYLPVLAPDPEVKKISREETLTPASDTVVGCYLPGNTTANEMTHIELLLSAMERLNKKGSFTLWCVTDLQSSLPLQQAAAARGLEKHCRFFDVTVQRSAFYKGCDIIFIPEPDLRGAMTLAEAGSLSRPVLICTRKDAAMISSYSYAGKKRGAGLASSCQNSAPGDKRAIGLDDVNASFQSLTVSAHVDDIAAKLYTLAIDKTLRIKYGEAGRQLYLTFFQPEENMTLMLKEYL